MLIDSSNSGDSESKAYKGKESMEKLLHVLPASLTYLILLNPPPLKTVKVVYISEEI
jgi:hypothetical protein